MFFFLFPQKVCSNHINLYQGNTTYSITEITQNSIYSFGLFSKFSLAICIIITASLLIKASSHLMAFSQNASMASLIIHGFLALYLFEYFVFHYMQS